MRAKHERGLACLREALGEQLGAEGLGWLDQECRALAGGDQGRLLRSLPMASRHAKRKSLAPSKQRRDQVAEAVPGLEIERWSHLDAARVLLICAAQEASDEGFGDLYEQAFGYADDGEQQALLRALPLLDDGARFAWRAGEGCRTNIVPVFEAVALDSPYPAMHFDEIAWNQMCIKAVFLGSPLHRAVNFDRRVNPELARMALDLADERRSAGRAVQPELWMCLDLHAGERGQKALDLELKQGPPLGRLAAVLGLARAQAAQRLGELANDSDPMVAEAAQAALHNRPTSLAFASVS